MFNKFQHFNSNLTPFVFFGEKNHNIIKSSHLYLWNGDSVHRKGQEKGREMCVSKVCFLSTILRNTGCENDRLVPGFCVQVQLNNSSLLELLGKKITFSAQNYFSHLQKWWWWLFKSWDYNITKQCEQILKVKPMNTLSFAFTFIWKTLQPSFSLKEVKKLSGLHIQSTSA